MSESASYVKNGLALYWEPAITTQFINYAYDRKALEAIEECFGDFPITLVKSDLPTLRALQIAGGGRPLWEIIKAVEDEGEIRIWWDSEKKKKNAERRNFPPKAVATLDAITSEAEKVDRCPRCGALMEAHVKNGECPEPY